MVVSDPLAFPLGLEGTALLRAAQAGDFPVPGHTEAGIAEIGKMPAAIVWHFQET